MEPAPEGDAHPDPSMGLRIRQGELLGGDALHGLPELRRRDGSHLLGRGALYREEQVEVVLPDGRPPLDGPELRKVLAAAVRSHVPVLSLLQ